MVTLLIMSTLLVGIVLVGDEFAKRLSLLFSAQTEEVEGGVEALPSKLTVEPGPVVGGETSPEELTLDADHTGAWIRRATREASIIARRAIARGASDIKSAGVQTE